MKTVCKICGKGKEDDKKWQLSVRSGAKHFFPNKNITMKMFKISFMMPKFMRESPGLLNLIFRLEQEGERLT